MSLFASFIIGLSILHFAIGTSRGSDQLVRVDTDNHHILPQSFPQINAVAGNGGNYAGPYTDADALTSGIGSPGNMWQDMNGLLYFYTFSGNSILKFDPVTNKISTFAGTGETGTPVNDSPALNTSFYTLSGLWGDSTGLYAADAYNCLLLKISWSDGNPVSIIAGGGNTAVTSTAITATDASLPSPYGVWGDGSGNLYITDQTACAIYAVNNRQIALILGGDCNTFPNQPSNVVGVVIGNTTFLIFGYSNGVALATTDPSKPHVLSLSGYGSGVEQIYLSPDLKTFYYARSSTNQIFATTDFSKPGVVVAGYGDERYSGDGSDAALAAALASLNQPVGVWQDPSTGSIYISDQSNLRIRVVTGFNPPTRRSSEELPTTTIITNDTHLIASIKTLLLLSHSTAFNNERNNNNITSIITPASFVTKHHLRTV